MTKWIALPILEISTFAVVTLACALAVVPRADELVLGWINRSNSIGLEPSQTVFASGEPQFVAENSVEPQLPEKNRIALLPIVLAKQTHSEFTPGNEHLDFDPVGIQGSTFDLPQSTAGRHQNVNSDSSLTLKDPCQAKVLEVTALPDSRHLKLPLVTSDAVRHSMSNTYNSGKPVIARLAIKPSLGTEVEPETWEFQNLPAVDSNQEPSQSPIRHQATEADPVFRSLPPTIR